MNQIRILIRAAEMALTLPHVQDRTPLARNLREFLIRQLWWGDQILTAYRLGEDYIYALGYFMLNRQAATITAALLKCELPK